MARQSVSSAHPAKTSTTERQDGLEASRNQTKPDVGQGGAGSPARGAEPSVRGPTGGRGVSGAGVGSIPAHLTSLPSQIRRAGGGRCHLTSDFSSNKRGCRQWALLPRVGAEPGSLSPIVSRKCQCLDGLNAPDAVALRSDFGRRKAPYAFQFKRDTFFFSGEAGTAKATISPLHSVTVRSDGYFCQSPRCQPRGGSEGDLRRWKAASRSSIITQILVYLLPRVVSGDGK